MNEKLEDLKRLALLRKSDQLSGYINPADIFDGKYDAGFFVSPFTRSASNLNAEIMLIAQDWASVESLSKLDRQTSEELIFKGYSEHLPTNRRLRFLLKEYLNVDFSDTYATNLFVFIKHGSISAKIKTSDLVYSAEKFTLREISIVKPRIVICLGATVFKIISRLVSNRAVLLKNSLDAPLSYSGAYILGVPHPGGLGTAAAGGDAAVASHWGKVQNFYERIASGSRCQSVL